MKGIAKIARGEGHVGIMEFPEPQAGPGLVKIEIKYAGICASDLHVWHDTIGLSVNPPVIMGHEFSGQVVAVGEGVTNCKPGDRVIAAPGYELCGKCDFCKDGIANMCKEARSLGFWYNGSFAKYLVLPARFIYHMDDKLTYKQAAVIEPMICAIAAVCKQAKVQASDIALVSGPGTIGLLTMQIARAQGATVIVTGMNRDEHRLKLAKELGAEYTVNLEKENLKEVVAEITNGYGPDVVLECSGSQAAINTGVQLLRRAGRYVQVGLPGSSIDFDIEQICYKDATFSGVMGGNAKEWRTALKLVVSGKVKTEPLVSHIFPMSEWEKAFALTANREGLKILLTPDLD